VPAAEPLPSARATFLLRRGRLRVDADVPGQGVGR
jgi:hypothetical protein